MLNTGELRHELMSYAEQLTNLADRLSEKGELPLSSQDKTMIREVFAVNRMKYLMAEAKHCFMEGLDDEFIRTLDHMRKIMEDLA